MKENVIIYCFTGSGNTGEIANTIAKKFEECGKSCKVIPMENIGKTVNIEIAEGGYTGLAFPVAIQSTYPLVWDFVERMPEGHNQKIFMVDTMSSFSGGVVGPMKKILKTKGYICCGAAEFKMSNSMETKTVDKQTLVEKKSIALMQAEEFVNNLLEGKTKWGRIPIISEMIKNVSKNRKTWTNLSKKIEINHDKCTLCGLCVKDCPVNAISIADGRIKIDYDKCICCMRCASHCPVQAYTYTGKVIQQNNNN